MYEVQPPSECVASLAVIQVHSRGIPDGLPGPLPPLPLTLGLQSEKLNALHVDARILGLVPQHSLSVSSSHSASTAAATMCTNKLTANHALVTPDWDCQTPNNFLASPDWGCLTIK